MIRGQRTDTAIATASASSGTPSRRYVTRPAHVLVPSQVCALEFPASLTFAMTLACAAVSTCATVELADSPGSVVTFSAYSVNSYLCELPPGHGPKNCWLVPDPPMPFWCAPDTFGTLKPLPSPSGNDVVAAGMSQIAQCLLPLAVSTR